MLIGFRIFRSPFCIYNCIYTALKMVVRIFQSFLNSLNAFRMFIAEVGARNADGRRVKMSPLEPEITENVASPFEAEARTSRLSPSQRLNVLKRGLLRGESYKLIAQKCGVSRRK